MKRLADIHGLIARILERTISLSDWMLSQKHRYVLRMWKIRIRKDKNMQNRTINKEEIRRGTRTRSKVMPRTSREQNQV